jgi:hypothetical protein
MSVNNWSSSTRTLASQDSLVTNEQIEAMAQVIWPTADSITVTRTKAARGERGPEGFQLAVSNDAAGLMAVISAETLGGLKDKLEQRSKKKQWGALN